MALRNKSPELLHCNYGVLIDAPREGVIIEVGQKEIKWLNKIK